jgi:DNA-binding NtrC family response regulator
MSLINFDQLSEEATNRGAPFSVLVVDDEHWVRDVLRSFCDLSDAFKVDMAGSGKEALDKIKKSEYDLVTLDLIMPDLSGLEVLSKAKKMKPDMPVMIITGNATTKIVNRAGVMGACRVLYKPIMLEVFIAELTSMLLGKTTH